MKPREWFAVKRTKSSLSYQFYEPNERNRETIEAIAPDCGNFEVVELIDRSDFDAIKDENERLQKYISELQDDLVRLNDSKRSGAV